MHENNNIPYISLQEAKQYLRINSEEDDKLILAMIKAVEEFANSYLSLQDKLISSSIRQAMLIHLASLYDNRWGNGKIPAATLALYQPHRKIRV
jgi:hypothetical protein